MNTLFQTLVFFLRLHLKKRVAREVKRRSILAYLRVLQATRLTMIAIIVGFIFIQVLTFSFFGVLVTGFLIWNHDFNAKMEILFWIFLGMFTLPALLVLIGLSESLWYRLSGAKNLVDSQCADK